MYYIFNDKLRGSIVLFLKKKSIICLYISISITYLYFIILLIYLLYILFSPYLSISNEMVGTCNDLRLTFH